MSSEERGQRPVGRRDGVSMAILFLLAGILVVLVVLIVVLLTQRGGGAAVPQSTIDVAVAEGQTVNRSELPKPPEPPEPVADPTRLKQALRVGKTYETVLKVGIDARVEDKAWAIKNVVSLAYMAEMQVDREIESNDGRRLVELRYFVAMRNVKLLCDVEKVSIDLGRPGTLLLGSLVKYWPKTATAAMLAKPIAELILGYGAQAVAQDSATKAVAHVDSLSGKKVRITYVDGVGVEAIEPVGCSLTAKERDFVFETAILSDCYIFPDVTVAPGESWQVDGAQLAGLLDPSLRARPSGRVVIIREADAEEAGKRYATLRLQRGSLAIDSSDESTRRVGGFTPEGTLRFDLADGYVDRADLTGRFVLESVSTDHILFETSFRSQPSLQISYSCTIR